MPIDCLPLLAALCLCAAAFLGFRHRRSDGFLLIGSEILTAAALAITMLVGIALALYGPMSSPVIGFQGVGFSARTDSLSALVGGLVAFIGWVVLRYARTYLDGERHHGAFIGWLCLTLAAVLLFVFAGNLVQLVLAWIGTSLFLHHLLLFYPERIGAQRAARKKFIMARLGDCALILAIGLLANHYDTVDLATILASAAYEPRIGIVVAAAWLLAVAALLKSAQFPTHGWLVEMMETPTPVSALLHAGVINAGGFLLIRFAAVMVLAPDALALLAIIGGFTAFFGALVMQTQPMAKTALAWSTISQMGFMMLECGFGLFPLALLHLVAHSLYKAHAFLSVGNSVAQIAARRRPGPIAIARFGTLIIASCLALFIDGSIGTLFGIGHDTPHALTLGSVQVFGTAYLLSQGLADRVPGPLTLRIAGSALMCCLCTFLLQTAVTVATQTLLPPPPKPGIVVWGIAFLTSTSFGGIAAAQILLPHWAHHPGVAALRVHLSNGFYISALLDRMLGGWTIRIPAQSRQSNFQ